MSASDDQKYANSLSQYLGGVSSYQDAVGDRNSRIDKYNELVNDTVTPIGDEFVRQAVTGVSGQIKKGLSKGAQLISGKIGKTAVEKAGNIIDQGIQITKKPAQLARTLGRGEIDSDVKNDVGKGIFKSERFGRNFANEAPKADTELADIAEANRGRAAAAAQRSGQILEQDGGGARPPPAQAAPDVGEVDPDDGTRYFDADEPKPEVQESSADTGEDVTKDVEQATEQDVKKAATKEGEDVVEDGLKAGAKVEAAGGGPEDLLGDIAAIGVGIGASILARKLKKKAPPPPAPVVTSVVSGASARGL
tara:strand:+ start:1372 stop:2292 length:921 start_codon:yes stop_codon:yes gene_type:complete